MSSSAARRSGEAIAADRSYSVEGFAEAVRCGVLEPTDRTWVIVDEAAMVDTRRMERFLGAAGPAVIRTVGDDRQLAPVGPGGWYGEQLARHPGAELTHVYRQRNPDDVRDFTDLGAGKVAEAVRSLDARNRIITVEEFGDRALAIVDLYRQERMRGRDAHDVGVVLDGSNHVLDDVNRRIQRERLLMAEISGTPLHVEATDDGRTWRLYRGDHVVFREKVITQDSTVIRNGERGEITGIDHMMREVTVALEGGRRVRVELAPEAPTQPVVPAYAHHVAAFQGGELAVPIVSPSRTTTRNSGYTAVTRARDDVHIVIDRETYGERAVDGLIRDWSRTVEKRTAWSQLDEVGREWWAAWNGRAAPDVAGEPEPVVEYERTTAMPERDDEPAEWTSDPYVTRDMRQWERGDAENAVPEAAPEWGHPVPESVTDERAAAPDAPPAETHRAYAEDGGEIGERARRGAEECEARLRDLEEIRAAIRDLCDAEMDRDDEADRRAAAESLAHGADVPPTRRFGDLDDIIARRRDRIAAPGRDDERALPSAEDLVDAILRGDGDVPGNGPTAEELLDTVRNRAADDVPAISALDMLDRIWSDPWVDERDRDDEREREL